MALLVLFLLLILLSPFVIGLKMIIEQNETDKKKIKGKSQPNNALDAAIKNKKLTSSSLWQLLVGSFAVGFAAWYSFNTDNIGLQVPVFFALFSVLVLYSASQFKKAVPTHTKLLIAASIGCFSFAALRASASLTSLNVSVGLVFMFVALASLAGKSFSVMTISDYIESWLLPIWSLTGLAGLSSALKKLRGDKKTRKVSISKEVQTGLFVAVPLVILFTVLFASADSTFSSLIPSLDFSSWNISETFLGAVTTTMLVGLFIAALLFYIFVQADTHGDTPTKAATTKSFSKTSALIVLGSVVALFAVFGATQLSIVFNTDTLSDTANLSENARRGFGQLVFASIVVFALLAFIDHSVPKKDIDSRFKSLSLALIGLTFLVLASAFMRLLATEAEFGFTLPRLYGHSYIIMIGVWLAALGAKMFYSLSWARFSQVALVSVFGYVLVINMINPDLFVARTNINRSDARDIDVRYLQRLSPDAWPAIEKGIESGVFGADAESLIDYKLCWQIRNKDALEVPSDWRSWNAPRRAYQKYVADSDASCDNSN